MKTPEDIFATLTGIKANQLTQLHSGLSNETYAINDEYALRIKKKSDPAFYRSREEKKIVKAAEAIGLSPAVITFNSKGDMVTKWIKNSRAYVEPAMSKEDIVSTVELLKKLHSLKATKLKFNGLKRYKHYKKKSGIKNTDSTENFVINAVKEIFMNTKPVLSHNDIVFGNLIKETRENRIYLIDYEFAGLNHPYFDLASFISENLLDGAETFNLVLDTYLGRKSTRNERHDLLIMIAFENYLWYYWAVARYLETNNEEFNTIARIKKDEINKTSSFLSKDYLVLLGKASS